MDSEKNSTITDTNDTSAQNGVEQEIQIAPQPATPEEEKQFIKKLEAEDTTRGMKAGDLYYILEIKWYKGWKEYVSYDFSRSYGEPRKPSEINNTILIEDDGSDEKKIKRSAHENYDFVFVSEKIWKHFQAWYGGGPGLSRKVIASGWQDSNLVIEVRPLTIKVYKSSALNDPIVVSFSKAGTIGEFKETMAKKLGANPEDVRVWDYHGNSRYKLLEDMKAKMENCQIIDNQSMLLEEKDATTGTWPEVKTSYSYSSAGTGYSYSSGYSSNYNSYSSNYYNSYSRPCDPGTAGLTNLGNTCFMNSSLQCLSNTGPLTDYFLQDKFKNEINRVNPLGMKGELAEDYASLVKEIWSGTRSVVTPHDFKRTLQKFAPQFAGYQQHDSQELLAFLLDGLHEDLNRVIDKPPVENPEVTADRSEQEVADEAWRLHKSRNNSAVVDLFQGQLKSTLVCPKCARVSVTFDPFMYLSLPLPMKMTRVISVTFYSADLTRKPVRYGVEIDKFASVVDLKKAVAVLSNTKAEHLHVLDVYNSKFFKQFNDRESVDAIQDRDQIWVYEVVLQDADEDADNNNNNNNNNKHDKEMSDGTSTTTNNNTTDNNNTTSNNNNNKADKDEMLYYPVTLRREETRNYYYNSSYYNTSYTSKTTFGIPFILSVPVSAGKPLTWARLYYYSLLHLLRFLKDDASELVQKLARKMEEEEVARKEGRDIIDQVNEEVDVVEADSNNNSSEGSTEDEEGTSTSTSDEEEAGDHVTATSTTSAESKRKKKTPNTTTTSGNNNNKSNNTTTATGSTTPKLTPVGSIPPLYQIFLTDGNGMDVGLVSPSSNVIPLHKLPSRTPLVLHFNDQIYQRLWNDAAEREVEIHSSARLANMNNNNNNEEGGGGAEQPVTLMQCVDMFTTKEQLGPEDPWYCNRCKEFVQATKQFQLWRTPKILVVHLKRFSYKNRYWREKLETFVDYPGPGEVWDLSSIVQCPGQEKPVYELYAVSNHYGSMGGGHYTAYGKNKNDNKWYKFDDSSVSPAESSRVKTSSAYVLFYKLVDSTDTSNNNNNNNNAATATPAATTTTTTTATPTPTGALGKEEEGGPSHRGDDDAMMD